MADLKWNGRLSDGNWLNVHTDIAIGAGDEAGEELFNGSEAQNLGI